MPHMIISNYTTCLLFSPVSSFWRHVTVQRDSHKDSQFAQRFVHMLYHVKSMSGRTPPGCCLLGAAGCCWVLLVGVWGARNGIMWGRTRAMPLLGAACWVLLAPAAIHAVSHAGQDARARCPCWVLLGAAGCCWLGAGLPAWCWVLPSW